MVYFAMAYFHFFIIERQISWWKKIHVANFLQKFPYRKKCHKLFYCGNFTTMGIFPDSHHDHQNHYQHHHHDHDHDGRHHHDKHSHHHQEHSHREAAEEMLSFQAQLSQRFDTNIYNPRNSWSWLLRFLFRDSWMNVQKFRGAAEEMLSFQAQLSRRLAAEMMVRQQVSYHNHIVIIW